MFNPDSSKISWMNQAEAKEELAEALGYMEELTKKIRSVEWQQINSLSELRSSAVEVELYIKQFQEEE